MSQTAPSRQRLGDPAREAHRHEHSIRLSAAELVAGATAGFAEHFIMFPFDTLKTRMQSGKASRMIEAVRQLGSGPAIRHLYRGCVPVLVSAVPAHAVYFGTYEAGKRIAGDGPVGVAVSAGFATVAHDTVSTPFDVVKQRMQMDGAHRYKTSLRCATHTLRHEGVNALFVSLPTTILMNIPHFTTYWLVYESLMRYAHDGQSRKHEEEATIEYIGAGFMAGGVASVVSFPLDLVKTRMQLGYGSNWSSILKGIVATRGLRGLFAGVIPRVMYTAPSGAIMIVTYETTKTLLTFGI